MGAVSNVSGDNDGTVAGAAMARVMLAVVILVAAGLGSVQVAQAAVAVASVPCSATALASAVSSATSGETLSLASGCIYHLTAGLPVISQNLIILGNGATLERSYAPGTPGFTILQADGGAVLTVTRLNFRSGNGAIAVRSLATLTVNGGIFTGNTAADGGAISDYTGANGPQVNGATFIANRATDSGGAISDFSAGDEFVTDSVFYRNKAGSGGALLLNPHFEAFVTGVIIHDNSATTDGAGSPAPPARYSTAPFPAITPAA